MIRIFNQYVSPKERALDAHRVRPDRVCSPWPALFDYVSGTIRMKCKPLIQFPDIIVIQGLVIVLTVQLCFYYSDLYNPNALRGRSDQLISLGQALGSACLVLGALLLPCVPSLLIGQRHFSSSLKACFPGCDLCQHQSSGA